MKSGQSFFIILPALATFGKDRIATRNKEVKQSRKAAWFYIGGRRGFRFNVVEGIKVPNIDEQKPLKQMKRMKEQGKTLQEIHCWLNNVKGKKLAYSSIRVAMLK